MIVFLTLVYVAVLFVLIKMKVLPNTTMTWLSTIVWIVVLFTFLFIPMQWGAPAGPARVITRAVQIVPNVAGTVVEIAVRQNVPLKEGDLLFKIDPEPFEIGVELAEASLIRVNAQALQDKDALANARAQVKQAEAVQILAQARYDDDAQLVQSGTISENRLQQRETDLDRSNAAVDQTRTAVSRALIELGAVTKDGVAAKVAEARARLNQAKWNLAQTEVRAPGDGFVTNLALATGQRVVTLPLAPSMLFVDTSEKILVAEIHQIYLRHVEPGQMVEIAMKIRPGEILSGTVETIINLTARGQAMVAGSIAPTGTIQPEPFFVRIKLDDTVDTDLLLPGVVGSVAIYTENVAATHVIRRVMLRMESILNYLNPAL